MFWPIQVTKFEAVLDVTVDIGSALTSRLSHRRDIPNWEIG